MCLYAIYYKIIAYAILIYNFAISQTYHRISSLFLSLSVSLQNVFYKVNVNSGD